MYIEINDPQHCTIIAQPPGGKLHPSAEQARTCTQCQQQTWAHTATCMWCGHDRWGAVRKWLLASAAALTAIAIAAQSVVR